MLYNNNISETLKGKEPKVQRFELSFSSYVSVKITRYNILFVQNKCVSFSILQGLPTSFYKTLVWEFFTSICL